MMANGNGYGREWTLAGPGGIADDIGGGGSIHPVWWHGRIDGNGIGDGKLPWAFTWYTDTNDEDIALITDPFDKWGWFE